MIAEIDKKTLKIYIERLINGKSLSNNEIKKIYRILDSL
tara:strand:- start:567 stop:683 length:117 start_codon:yes stop_codon:yes gene_type:complete